jgi:hypothetical protein
LKDYMRARELSRSDPDLALLGTSLFASAVGMLVMIKNTSFVLGTQKMFWVLAGLAAAYATLERLPLKRLQRHPLQRDVQKILQD